jgi:ankyrin repeat protein
MDLSELDTHTINTNVFSQLSELSQSEQTHIQDGGFLDFLCNDSKTDKAVLEAVRLKKYDIVKFFIEKDLIESYEHQDENGNTLLHYLALDYETTWKLIEKILERSDIKSFINIQNKNGDTALILAVIGSHHDLCEKLVKH